MLERFDYATYRRLLSWISRDRRCVGFRQAVEFGDEPCCIVRHDVDFSLPAALRMAEVEAEAGVKATYFLLFSAERYNLLHPVNARVPAALVGLGHEVGLHYDTTAMAPLEPAAAHAALRAQATLLEALSGAPVETIARHNPGFGGADPFAAQSGFISAYDERFTGDIVYLSDSCGAWRPEALEVLGAPQPPHRLQLLTHPLFWDEHAVDRWTHLERLHRAGVDELDAHVAFVRDVWGAHPAVAEYDRRVGVSEPPRAG